MTAARVTCRRSIGLAILSSLATLGLAAGCPVVGNPPTDTIIACENNAGCPQGWECLPSGRCLATGDGAVPAPQIIAVDVSPAGRKEGCRCFRLCAPRSLAQDAPRWPTTRVYKPQDT